MILAISCREDSDSNEQDPTRNNCEDAMKGNTLDDLLVRVGELVRVTPMLRDFAPWPNRPSWAELEPLAVPAISLIEELAAKTTRATSPIVASIKSMVREVCWQQTYTEAEVGADFLSRYGWFELVGPTGHYLSDSTRAFIAFWGADLHYPAHLHEAEELYYVLAGSAEFHSEGQPSAQLVPGGTRYHASEPRPRHGHAHRTGVDAGDVARTWA